MKIHSHNSHKQIDTENTANDNKHNKQDTDPTVIIHNGPRVILCAIDRGIHVIRPSLQRGQHEQGDHGVEDVVEVDVPVQPNTGIFGKAVGLVYVVQGGELGGVAVTGVAG